MRRHKLLYIEWDDHSAHGNRWQERKDLAKRNEALPCISVGAVIAEDDHAITLASSWTNADWEPDYSGANTILKNCIRKRRVLSHK